MRIGLISDTHIPEAGPALPPQVFRALQGVDLVLHAGDLHILEVLDWLEALAPVRAVRGNGDEPQGPYRPGVPEDPRIAPVQVLEVEGLTVGMVHAFPLPEDVPWADWDALLVERLGQRVDVLVVGDTHIPLVRRHNGLLLVNPGSPTLPYHTPGLGTVALLEVEQGQVRAQVVPLA